LREKKNQRKKKEKKKKKKKKKNKEKNTMLKENYGLEGEKEKSKKR